MSSTFLKPLKSLKEAMLLYLAAESSEFSLVESSSEPV